MADGNGQRARSTWAFTAVLLAMLAAACSGRQLYHQVRPGETLYRIGKAYGVSVQRLAQANGLRDPSRLEVGQRLVIPGAQRQLPVNVITPSDVNAKAPRHDELPPAAGPRLFTWPVASGSLSSGFGPRGSSFHDGIDIAAPFGAAVVAAADGEVIYSDALSGYGNVIILRHGDGYATVYAHNRENQTHEGVRVRRGQAIATVGNSGRTSGPNLHFEVRHDNVARNPLYYLPPTVVSGAGH